MTEADEAAKDKATALDNLREQVAKRETAGVIAMYQVAAWNVGATVGETDAAMKAGRERRTDSEGEPERLYRGWKLDRY